MIYKLPTFNSWRDNTIRLKDDNQTNRSNVTIAM